MNATLSVPRRWPVGLLVAGGALLLLLAGGGVAYWQLFADPPKPWVLKWRIHRYLKKQSGRSDFRIAFPFPSKQEMAAAPAAAAADAGRGARSEKDFDSFVQEYVELEIQVLRTRGEIADLRRELEQGRADLAALEQPAAAPNATARPTDVAALRAHLLRVEQEIAARQQSLPEKEKAVAPVADELWAIQRAWATQRDVAEAQDTNALAVAVTGLLQDMRRQMADAHTYEAMYRLIGQQLWVADRLLESRNVHHRRQALRLARQAGRDALYQAENGGLASLIYLTYVLPHLDLAEGRGAFESLLNECTELFRRVDDLASTVQCYKILLARAATPQRADSARAQIAQAYERAGQFEEALHWLRQIKNTNEFAWAVRRIPWIERQAGVRQ